jgi:tellurite methyltransferase
MPLPPSSGGFVCPVGRLVPVRLTAFFLAAFFAGAFAAFFTAFFAAGRAAFFAAFLAGLFAALFFATVFFAAFLAAFFFAMILFLETKSLGSVLILHPIPSSANDEFALYAETVPRNWDEYYADAANLDVSPAPLLVSVADLLPPGTALDLACGAGGNAIYLATLGWRVTAIDRSAEAIRQLRARAGTLPIDSRVEDLEDRAFSIEPAAYDLICDFYYLQRDLFPKIRVGIRPGGVFAAAIHVAGGVEGSFLLEPGELRAAFAGWKILFYSEIPEGSRGRHTARIIARRA